MKNSKKTKKLLAAISCLAMVENVGDMNGKKVYAGNTQINVPTNVNNTTTTTHEPQTTKTWSTLKANHENLDCANCETLKKAVELIE